jgi:hypothetical protein
LLALATILGSLCCRVATPLPTESLRLRLHDHAGVPAATKTRAIQEAQRILDAAGVRAVLEEADPLPSGEVLMPGSADVLFVRILPKDLAPQGSAIGYTHPVGEGQFRWLAYIFYQRASGLARDRGGEGGRLLGHLIAHEVGHLLLGRQAHALAGILRCPWGTAEMKEAERGRLLFSDIQADRMRVNVARRLSAGR